MFSYDVLVQYGHLWAVRVVYAVSHSSAKTDFQNACADQFIPNALMHISLPFTPGNPGWPIQKGEDDKAREMLRKL
ncbi:hypothetical protein JCM24511_06139 [Saitozyma sp. JCM 24511]|nr:hypothetical protein JCM24511_06139 [Saitozyma sp. JCM 24511]